jgi:hypothetical protein
LLESGGLEKMRSEKVNFHLHNASGVLFERFELPEEEVSTCEADKNIEVHFSDEYSAM